MKSTTLILIFLLFGLLMQCVPVSTTTSSSVAKDLVYDDHNYESIVGLSEVYPYSPSLNNDLENAVIEVGSEMGLFLQFDLFQENYIPLNVRYIHCNANWTPSTLTPIRFLDEYNLLNIENYSYSVNTRQPYVQYSIRLPTPKISGNYLIVVSRGTNDQDYLLSRRVLVFTNHVNTDVNVALSKVVKDRFSHQQINFSLSYGALKDVIPSRDMSVVILKNHRWDQALKNLTPTSTRPDQSILEYNHFNGENTFPGGNEFRFFDLRSIDFRGMNVANIQKEDSRILAFVGLDKPRTNTAYSLQNDINGRFYIVNSDPGDSQMMNEYVEVYFELQTPQVDGEVYVIGRYNQWQKIKQNLMQYDDERGSYRAKLQLKQGYYNYAYWLESVNKTGYYFENSHYQTINEYEILVYYRSPYNNYDELVGYTSTKSTR